MIDCDVHNPFLSLNDLRPWLDPGFRDYFDNAGSGVGNYAQSGYSLPSPLWVHLQGWAREDAVPEDGGPAGSSYELLREQLLDGCGVEYAILNGEDMILAPVVPNPHLAAALCIAYNRWLIEEWLPRDARFKGSLFVPTQDPSKAAEVIRMFGDHPDIIQVILASGSSDGFGHPRFHPIYEAASELGLVIGVHPGGDGIGMTGPPTATGYPSFYLEWHTLFSATAMSHLVSLIAHGVFERYPKLRWTMIELGVAWLPGLLWRLDSDWKSLRSEVPWVKRPPSEIVHEHVRLTTQPLEDPPNGRQLKMFLECFPAFKDILMFATDYPHWDSEAPELIARKLPDGWSDAVLSENARRHYPKLPSRAPEPDEAIAVLGS